MKYFVNEKVKVNGSEKVISEVESINGVMVYYMTDGTSYGESDIESLVGSSNNDVEVDIPDFSDMKNIDEVFPWIKEVDSESVTELTGEQVNNLYDNYIVKLEKLKEEKNLLLIQELEKNYEDNPEVVMDFIVSKLAIVSPEETDKITEELFSVYDQYIDKPKNKITLKELLALKKFQKGSTEKPSDEENNIVLTMLLPNLMSMTEEEKNKIAEKSFYWMKEYETNKPTEKEIKIAIGLVSPSLLTVSDEDKERDINKAYNKVFGEYINKPKNKTLWEKIKIFFSEISFA